MDVLALSETKVKGGGEALIGKRQSIWGCERKGKRGSRLITE